MTSVYVDRSVIHVTVTVTVAFSALEQGEVEHEIRTALLKRDGVPDILCPYPPLATILSGVEVQPATAHVVIVPAVLSPGPTAQSFAMQFAPPVPVPSNRAIQDPALER
jgi:hypothetical protein